MTNLQQLTDKIVREFEEKGLACCCGDYMDAEHQEEVFSFLTSAVTQAYIQGYDDGKGSMLRGVGDEILKIITKQEAVNELIKKEK